MQWWKKFICNLTLTSGGKGGYIVDLSRLNPILLFYIWHVISSFRWLGYIGVSLKVLNQKKFESLTGKHDKKNYAAHCTLHVCRRWCCSCNLSTFVEPPVYWASVNTPLWNEEPGLIKWMVTLQEGKEFWNLFTHPWILGI